MIAEIYNLRNTIISSEKQLDECDKLIEEYKLKSYLIKLELRPECRLKEALFLK